MHTRARPPVQCRTWTWCEKLMPSCVLAQKTTRLRRELRLPRRASIWRRTQGFTSKCSRSFVGKRQRIWSCPVFSLTWTTLTTRWHPTILCVLTAEGAVVSPVPIVPGGQFLLMLKKRGDGEFTADWYPLAPVNEQLHSVNDPWLLWVRKQAKAPSS